MGGNASDRACRCRIEGSDHGRSTRVTNETDLTHHPPIHDAEQAVARVLFSQSQRVPLSQAVWETVLQVQNQAVPPQLQEKLAAYKCYMCDRLALPHLPHSHAGTKRRTWLTSDSAPLMAGTARLLATLKPRDQTHMPATPTRAREALASGIDALSACPL